MINIRLANSRMENEHMSGAAKKTLLKSVAQVIPTCAMSIFLLSAGLCDDLFQIAGNSGGVLKRTEERCTVK
jgi:hypothetical protein